MTILYLSDIRFPLERANGIQSMETCAALAGRGHDVHLLVRPDTHVPARDPLAFYGLASNPRLHFERAAVFGPPPARRAAYLAEALERVLERRRWDVVFTRDLGVADLALRLPRRMRPPIIYESHGFAPILAAMLPRMVSGARTSGAVKLSRLHRRERRVWRGAEGYVAITRTLVTKQRSRFGARPRVAVVPSGVRLDPDRAYVAARCIHPPTVAYAGHFYPWKGPDVLVRALARLTEVRGLLIGGQPGESDRASLEELARVVGVTKRLTFAGQVPPGAVAALLQGADVLVLPTLATPYAEYTSPLKLFEYMGAGRPIVCSDLPPLREVVSHGRTALLVTPGDPEALAEGMRELLADPVAAERMARAAFDAAPSYSWERRAERLEGLFKEVVVASGGGAAAGAPRDRVP